MIVLMFFGISDPGVSRSTALFSAGDIEADARRADRVFVRDDAAGGNGVAFMVIRHLSHGLDRQCSWLAY